MVLFELSYSEKFSTKWTPNIVVFKELPIGVNS